VSPYIFAELTHSPNPLATVTDNGPDSNKNHSTTIVYHRCIVHRLRPPPDPNAPPAQAPAPAPVPRLLHPASADSDKHDEMDTPKDGKTGKEVYIGWSTHVPEEHIAPSALWEGLDEWDLVL